MTISRSIDYAQARDILGDDFISPEIIEDAYGIWPYNIDQLNELDRKLPTEMQLKWCHDRKLILMPGPPRAMSLLEIWELEKDGLRDSQKAWYTDQKFARNDKVEPIWIAYAKKPITRSLGKSWWEQVRLLFEPSLVPNAAELHWGLKTIAITTDNYLLSEFCSRTLSVDSNGHQFGFGHYGPEGLRAVGYSNDDRYPDLGLLPIHKF